MVQVRNITDVFQIVVLAIHLNVVEEAELVEKEDHHKYNVVRVYQTSLHDEFCDQETHKLRPHILLDLF